MHPTPSLSHLKPADYQHVYEPAEDTFLFLDALEADVKFITSRSPMVSLEIGSGTGIITAFLQTLLTSHGIPLLSLTTDINAQACKATVATALSNRTCVDAIRTDLALPLFPRLENGIDILLFNPPYVVTESEEVGSTGIEAAWAGGKDGREVVDRVLRLIPGMLSKKGMFYLVTIRENKPQEMMEYMSTTYNLRSDVVLSRKAGTEGLSILKFYFPA
ncbi:hypothetical protein SpCBS45565_g02710 [Spizellomyces sp. 'palustris']|nr:hypothetical protein SpCBS45565_g02710 [Spizellomyces sp. 'palustris']